MFKRVALHARQYLKKTEYFSDVLSYLENISEKIFLTPEAAEYTNKKFPKVDFSAKYDIFVVLGGDGSVLNIAGRMENFSTPVLAISAGTLGFLAEIKPEDFAKACEDIFKKEFTYDHRCFLDVRIHRANGEQQKFRALNDAVISQSDLVRLAAIHTSVNEEYLTTYRADGLIVSTPTGSTAYSLSAGGPIVYPHFRALILTPVAPHSLSHRSLVLPESKHVQVAVDEDSRVNLLLTIDGQKAFFLEKGDVVDIGVHKKEFTFFRLPEEHFFKTIVRKMHWGEACNSEEKENER